MRAPNQSRAHLWFIAPALVLMFLVLILPILIAGYMSLTNFSLGNDGADFVGLKNYTDIFT